MTFSEQALLPVQFEIPNEVKSRPHFDPVGTAPRVQRHMPPQKIAIQARDEGAWLEPQSRGGVSTLKTHMGGEEFADEYGLPPSRMVEMDTARLAEHLRGRGIGKQLYLSMLDSLEPDQWVYSAEFSEDAQRVRDSLIRDGLIEMVGSPSGPNAIRITDLGREAVSDEVVIDEDIFYPEVYSSMTKHSVGRRG